jgi:hypothetical protein
MQPSTTDVQIAVPTVSVVIPTRNRPMLVTRSLAVLVADPIASEILVAVDGDELDEQFFARWTMLDRRVRVIRSQEREESITRGIGGHVRDAAAVKACGEVVLALDDDVIPTGGLVAGHARWHASRDHLVVLGYMPVFDPASSLRKDNVTARVYSDSYERACRRFDNDSATVLTSLWGGNYSLRRDDWLASMELPRSRAGYHDDREFGLRLRELGLEPVFDRTLRAEHVYSRTLEQMLEDAESAGVGYARIRTKYGGSLPAEEAFRSRAITRVLQTTARTMLGWKVISHLMLLMARGAASMKLPHVERAAASVLWQTAYDRGMRLADRLPGERQDFDSPL